MQQGAGEALQMMIFALRSTFSFSCVNSAAGTTVNQQPIPCSCVNPGQYPTFPTLLPLLDLARAQQG